MSDRAPLPYDFMPEVPSFTVESDDVTHGELMGDNQVYNGFGMSGQNISPHLSWHGFPPETRELRRHLLRPGRPDRLGVLALDRHRHPRLGHRTPGQRRRPRRRRTCPAGAFSVRNDYGTKDFGGAAPPQGDPRAPVRVRGPRARHRQARHRLRRHPRRGRLQPALPHHRPRPGRPGLRPLTRPPRSPRRPRPVAPPPWRGRRPASCPAPGMGASTKSLVTAAIRAMMTWLACSRSRSAASTTMFWHHDSISQPGGSSATP